MKMTGNSFSLEPLVLQRAEQLKETVITDHTLNAAAVLFKENPSDANTIELCALLYRACGVRSKLDKHSEAAWNAVTDRGDFFSVFLLKTWVAALQYNPSMGNFKNYLYRILHGGLKDAQECSFNGGRSKNNEYVFNPDTQKVEPKRWFTHSTGDFLVGSSGETRKCEMREDIRLAFDSLTPLHRKVMKYIFLCGHTYMEAAKKFDLTFDQVRYIVKVSKHEIAARFPELKSYQSDYDDFTFIEMPQQDAVV